MAYLNSDNDSEITVVIPAKNENRTIGELLDRLLLNFSASNIMVVVDEVTDATIEVAKRRGVRVITGESKGKGSAVRLAIKTAKSGILLFMDADGSHNPSDIPLLVQPIIRGSADLVIASRMKGGSEEFSGNISNRMHYYANIMASFMVNLIWGHGEKIITDCNNGFRAIRVKMAKQLNLKENSFTIEQEMTVQCLKRGYKVEEAPSYEFKRQYGKSNVNSIKMLPRHIWCFIKDAF